VKPGVVFGSIVSIRVFEMLPLVAISVGGKSRNEQPA
jgi:hypothetical protein